MRVYIIGDGLQLPYLIESFVRKGHEIVVIHKDRAYCTELARKFDVQIIHGDGTNPKILEDAGIQYADIVIAMKPNDDQNFVICEMAERIYNVPKTLAVVHNPKNIEVFEQLGIKNVISLTEMITSFIEQKMNLDNITELYTNDDERISVLEIDIKNDYKAVGKKISAIGLPKESIISCIIREDGAIIPKASTKVEIGDRLITYSLVEKETELIAAIRG